MYMDKKKTTDVILINLYSKGKKNLPDMKQRKV